MLKNYLQHTVYLIMVLGASYYFFLSCKEKEVIKPKAHFCTILPGKTKKDTSYFPEFLGSNLYKWKKKATLKVYFYNGKKAIQQTTLEIANEWSKFCNIKFEQIDKAGLSDIRITFRTDRGYCSYVGSEANYFPGDSTMFLQNIDMDIENGHPDARRIILHEFGHALGLQHELQHPDTTIPWDTVAVYKFYKEKYKWDSLLTYQQVFEQINDISLKSRFDTLSIMIYAVPPELTKNKKYSIRWPKDLSAVDKEYIEKYYPLLNL